MRSKWGLYWRGMAMGAVETIPGVSSGTLALIVGIYSELISTLANIHPRLLRVWREAGTAAMWRELNGNFLVLLLLGMVTSIIPSVLVITWFMAHAPVVLWAFFSGLIVMGTYAVWRTLPHHGAAVWVAAFLACGFSVWLSLQTGFGALAVHPVVFFFAGALAISALLLPGISGSFILLLLGMYEPVLTAVRELHVAHLAAFIVGCAVGALAFVQLLKWLLAHYYAVVMAAAAGIMAGSLVKLWPWRITLESGAQQWLTPEQYSQFVQGPAQLGAAIVALLLGAVVVFFLGDTPQESEIG